MNPPKVSELRRIAADKGLTGLVVISFNAGEYAISTYGATKRKCGALQNWSDDIEKLVLDTLPDEMRS